MKRLFTLLAVAASSGFLFALVGGEAQGSLQGCFGAQVDPGYTAAFDKLPGQGGTNGQVDLPYQAFYREAQSWATRPGEDPGHHSEHFHMALCIPNGQTMTGPFDLYIAYTFHNVADYQVLSASMSTVTQNGSNSLWSATPTQIAQLQAAADASGDGSVQRVYLSVRTNAPLVNGKKEARGALTTQENGPTAIFHTWHFDPRWYYTDNVAGLPGSTQQPSQLAIRNRSQITARRADGSITGTQYHHSGWCGMNGQPLTNPSIPTACPSQNWTRATISAIWADTKDKLIQLYVTDGGGDAFLMIDPDFHNHYDAPTAACPNVDANGNCLGKWYWQPDNARHELFGNTQPTVTIPASVIASLAPGFHKLVFLSSDAPDCERLGTTCPADVRGEWSNIEVLPFKVI